MTVLQDISSIAAARGWAISERTANAPVESWLRFERGDEVVDVFARHLGIYARVLVAGVQEAGFLYSVNEITSVL